MSFNSSQFNSNQFNGSGGGSGYGVYGEGNYFFYNSLIVLDETISPSIPIAKTVRLTTNVGVTYTDETDLIDARTGEIDDWKNFDGVDADDGDVVVYYRTTPDVNVSPQIWSEWSPFHVAEVYAMGVEFKANLYSFDSNVNVLVNTLEIYVDEVI